jgi:DNA (cytosine-5)-methyltransferase 1
MIYGSICSGIETASVAWAPLGWRAAWFSEIDRFPAAVLRARWPDVPNLGDFTRIGRETDAGRYGPIELLVGGTPCQSFSVAGLRGGLADDRGNLALEFLRLAGRLRPRWLVWENVTGVLSSLSHDAPDPVPPAPPVDMGCDGQEMETDDEYGADQSHGFACVLAGLSELGYGFAYRVLDAQYVRVDGLERAVPQRRGRVFVVGYSGKLERPGDAPTARDLRRFSLISAAALFEPEGLQGHSAPRRRARSELAASLAGSSGKRGGLQEHDNLIAPPRTGNQYGDHESREGLLVAIAFTAKDYGADAIAELAPTLRAMGHHKSHANAGGQVAIAVNARQDPVCHDAALPLDTDSGTQAIALADPAGPAVRRLTPIECERLMGLSDDYTRIAWRGKPASACPDGPRYKALGNGMAANVMRWIGGRIERADQVAREHGI